MKTATTVYLVSKSRIKIFGQAIRFLNTYFNASVKTTTRCICSSQLLRSGQLRSSLLIQLKFLNWRLCWHAQCKPTLFCGNTSNEKLPMSIDTCMSLCFHIGSVFFSIEVLSSAHVRLTLLACYVTNDMAWTLLIGSFTGNKMESAAEWCMETIPFCFKAWPP